METDDLFKRRLEDLYRKSYTNGCFTFTDFSSEQRASYAFEIASASEAKLWGGAKGCERVMVRFGNNEELGYELDFPIKALHFTPLNKKFAGELTHRDFLGSLMSLGIERDTIGDIIVKDKEAFVFVAERIAEHIIANIDRIGNTTVVCKEADGEICVFEPSFEERKIIVSSPRIDAVISKLYNLSRSASRNLFTSGLVLINGKSCGNESLEPESGDVFAVRGYGKFIYDGAGKETKKGNVVLMVRVFI